MGSGLTLITQETEEGVHTFWILRLKRRMT